MNRGIFPARFYQETFSNKYTCHICNKILQLQRKREITTTFYTDEHTCRQVQENGAHTNANEQTHSYTQAYAYYGIKKDQGCNEKNIYIKKREI